MTLRYNNSLVAEGAIKDSEGNKITTTYAKSSSLATVATSGAYSDLSGTPTLATVATSGSYTDLSNTPTLGTMASESASDYTPTSNLATVATSGSYTDLTGTPTIATSVDSTSTNSETVGAKLFYDTVGDIETLLQAV